ncbi:GNAT family N-acetyltransferase [Winogradskyella maritima]|uniref:GNAT family N-acetyltransferase n=1 Tax=Winogradskyella maritima TaxID=1517766 RepID=A0ABV8AH43_9FLAO|nr:GNAT family N-acetyltransferase [Winogradskyella maritima]
MNTEITYHRAYTDEELHQILEIQKQNLKVVLSETDKQSEGFVSVDHTFDALKRMNDACPHMIAKSGGQVVGYALCMLNEFRDDVPELIEMFNYMDGILEEKGLDEINYLIMGQICIDKHFRKRGIFRGLYAFLTTELQSEFDALVTEVNVKNRRSSEAHKAVGFELLDVHTEGGEDWELIILKLK